VCQQADAAPALGAHQKCTAGTRRPAEPCLLGETSWLRLEALLRLLCSAARCAPCALHASPAELTYSHLHAVQRVGMLHCAGWPTGAAQVQPP